MRGERAKPRPPVGRATAAGQSPAPVQRQPACGRRDMRAVLLLTLLPKGGHGGVWDCSANPLAQAVVGDGGSNSYSSIISWNFGTKTFATVVSKVTQSDGSNLRVNGCSYDSASQHVFCFRTGSVELFKLDGDGIGTLMSLSWAAGTDVDCTVVSDGQVVAAGAHNGVKYFILAGGCSKSLHHRPDWRGEFLHRKPAGEEHQHGRVQRR